MRFIASLLLFLTPALYSLAGQKPGTTPASNVSTPGIITDTTAVLKPAQVLNEIMSAEKLLFFAQTFIGTPYHFGSANPLHGFDCSGFVNYVFKNFNFAVPRSAAEFLNFGTKVNMADAQPGDVIVFKGTKTYHPHKAGHMGIVLSNQNNELKFIHASSGKEKAVTITTLDDYYRRRLIQVVRIFGN